MTPRVLKECPQCERTVNRTVNVRCPKCGYDFLPQPDGGEIRTDGGTNGGEP